MRTLVGAEVEYCWLDDGTLGKGYFSFGEPVIDGEGDMVADAFGVPDEDIFFYCEHYEDLLGLMQEGKADFKVLSYELVYLP